MGTNYFLDFTGAAICRFEPYKRNVEGKVSGYSLRVKKVLEPFYAIPAQASKLTHPPVPPKEGECVVSTAARERGDSCPEAIIDKARSRKSFDALQALENVDGEPMDNGVDSGVSQLAS